MIKGGAWEIDIYPHCPYKYAPKDILYRFFISFDGEMLEGEIVGVDEMLFIFIHRRTKELNHPEEELIYTTETSPLPNHVRMITKPRTKIEKKIAELFKSDKVFFSDNEVGDIVRNYFSWCVKH